MAWFRETGWRHCFMLALVIVTLFPMAYIVSASLNPIGTLSGSNELFADVTLDNYRALLANPNQPYPLWWINTVVIASSTAALTVLISALAAYAFSRFRFRARRGGLFGLLLVQMFPAQMAFIALFAMLLVVGGYFPVLGLGSRPALVLVYLGGALGVNTWLMKGYFDSVPRDIDESARMDGAGHARIFFTLLIPMVKPVLVVVATLVYLTVSNEYLVARTVLGDDPTVKTLPVGLGPFVGAWGIFAAGAVLGAIPPVIAFLFAQKRIASGLLASVTRY